MQPNERHRNGRWPVKRISLILPTNFSNLVPIDSIEVFGPLGVSPELLCEFVFYNWDGIDSSYECVSPVMNNFSDMVDHILQDDESPEPTTDIDAYYQSNTPEFYSEFVRIKNSLTPFLGDIPSGMNDGEVEQMNITSSRFADHQSPAVVDLYVKER